ncbi:hypothetical protein Tco_0570242 [Tanacetum coccineum]
MLLCKQEEVGVQLNAEQADWKDDTDDESEEQELEAHYMYNHRFKRMTKDESENDLDQERDLLALIQKLKKVNNELSKTNQLMFKDLKKFQAELDKYNDVNYASNGIDWCKAKGDLMSFKIDFEKSSNAFTQKINDLNQTISDMKKELCAHQETISIMSQEKEAQIKPFTKRS